MADQTIKVTDKRMFTRDGELREDYRFLEEVEAAPAATGEKLEPDAAQEAAATIAETVQSTATEVEAGGGREAAAVKLQAPPPGYSATGPDVGPRFYDLVAALAEPATVYLGDQPLPGGQSAENLELARFYIDLLGVLRQTTAGNLPAQEAAFLEDSLYQLRVRYVQKSG